MNYVASLSCGKDSLAMVLRLLEENKPLTHVVMFDTEMEFKAIYRNLEKITDILQRKNVIVKVIRPETNWLFDMMVRPVCNGTCKEHYGYEWCGGCTRWRTSNKITSINKYLQSIGEYIQYVGIAKDEPERVKAERNKQYPLVEWGMTEKDCLKYCYDMGYDWKEDGVELYDVLDRVSCWCCGNKNIKELRNMYHYLPTYWGYLKGLQSRIDRPFHGEYTIFELEKRFQLEDAQISFYDMGWI